MREALKSAFHFTTAPAWRNYVISPFGVNSTGSDAEIDDFIRENTGTVYHPVGTASMSPQGATWGVVDPDLTVKGLSGLRIVDLSIVVSHQHHPPHLSLLRIVDSYPGRSYAGGGIHYRREGLGFDQGSLESKGSIPGGSLNCSNPRTKL